MDELEHLKGGNPSRTSFRKYEATGGSKFSLLIEVFSPLQCCGMFNDDVSDSLCGGECYQLSLYWTGQVMGLHRRPQVNRGQS